MLDSCVLHILRAHSYDQKEEGQRRLQVAKLGMQKSRVEMYLLVEEEG